MKKNYKKFDEAWKNQAFEGYHSWIYSEILNKKDQNARENLLYERKRRLNKEWQLIPNRIKRLDLLNQYLRKIEDEVDQYHIQLEKKILREIKRKNNLITDYNIFIEVGLWSQKKYKKLRIQELYENAFFTFQYSRLIPTPGVGFRKAYKEHLDFRNSNWNEVAIQDPKHPISLQHHCHLLYRLYNNYPLAWSDIVEIESVWIDVKVDYQFEREFRIGKTKIQS